MIKMRKIRVQRFRSIMDLTLELDESLNIVSICGQNNVGKTNLLKAINLFFNPSGFIHTEDVPRCKQENNWSGASVYPNIEITFFDTATKNETKIKRDFKKVRSGQDSLSGQSKTVKLNNKECETYLKKINFYYIESINTIIPDIIEKLTGDILVQKYQNSKFTSGKDELKKGYDNYIDGIEEILNKFADSLSDSFAMFKDSWKIKFKVPKASRFVDMISYDVQLSLDDKGAIGIDNKGSGLQRLCLMVLQFEILNKIKNANPIVLIDEPDLYLHDGMQSKFKEFLYNKSLSGQIMYTTHSKTFINAYCEKNTILLDTNFMTKQMAGKQVESLETIRIDISSENGYKQICEHLGIEIATFDPLMRHNILVEGKTEVKYFTELAEYFNLPKQNIIPVNGCDNIKINLNYYNGYYENLQLDYKPKIKVLLDNDAKGREVYRSIEGKISKYNNLEIELVLLPNYDNTSNMDTNNKNQTNNEIEDFMYPSVIAHLTNLYLGAVKLQKISEKKLVKSLENQSFKQAGILQLIEHEKNTKNPDVGMNFSFVSSGGSTSKIKGAIANKFSLQLNREMIDLVKDADNNYPHVKSFLTTLFEF